MSNLLYLWRVKPKPMQDIVKKILLSLMLLPGLLPLFAETPFVSLGVDEGLGSNKVTCITGDKSGFIYFGTSNGLCRYDGQSFRIFRKNDPRSSLASSSITSLLSSSDGLLYVGTDNGAYSFEPQSEIFSKIDLPKLSSAIEEMIEDRKGIIWICCGKGGLYRYNPKDGDFWHYEVSQGNLPSYNIAAIDLEGTLYFGSNTDKIVKVKPQSNRFEALPCPKEGCEISSLYFDPHANTLILGTASDGLYSFDIAHDSWKCLLEECDGEKLRHINSIQDNCTTSYFVGCDNGIIACYKDSNYSSIDCGRYTCPKESAIECLYVDREGGLWIGTSYYGALYLRPNYRGVEQYLAAGAFEGRTIVSCFARSNSDRIWVGTGNRGLMIFDPLEETIVIPSGSPLEGSISSILQSKDGDLWVGIQQRLERYSLNGDNSLKAKGSYPLGKVNSLLQSSEGTIYAACGSEVKFYDPGTSKFENLEIFRGVSSKDIIQDPEGYIWIATGGRGLVRYSPKTGRSENYSSDQGMPSSIYSICLDDKMNVYCASASGLLRLNRADNSVQSIMPETLQGEVNFVGIDLNGNIWASTGNGVCTIDGKLKKAKFYTKDDGLQSNKFNSGAGYIHPEGLILLGGVNGFNAIWPALLSLPDYSRPSISLECSAGKGEKLRLKESDARLSFEASVLSFYSPANNSCSYKMEGVDEDWTTTKGKAQFQYNLRSGNYTLRVRGENADGLSVEKEKAVYITILPPLWRSPWMIALYIVLAIGAIGSGVFLSRKHLDTKHQNELLQVEVRRKEDLSSSRISFFSNVIYELSNPLSQIRSGLGKINSGESETEALEQIRSNVGKISDLLERLRKFKDLPSDDLSFPLSKEEEPVKKPSIGGKVVLVDQNEAQKEFLTTALEDRWELSQDIEEAQKGLCDLVIFDEKVPSVDEIFKKVRENPLSCHIPAIYLSARSDEKTRESILSKGYDAIAEKPLSLKLLCSQIENLIKSRRAIRETYVSSPLLPSQSIARSDKDAEFIQRTNSAIMDNISETENIIEIVAEQLNMSRASFRRKLTEISGMPPSRYIQLARLKKAAEMLRTTDLKVGEIGFKVGFATPSYFSKCFFAQFGMLPKDYRG